MRLRLVLLLSAISLFSGSAYADICFPDEVSGAMLVEVEECRANLPLLEQVAHEQADAIGTCKEAVEGCQTLLKDSQVSCDAIVEASKPGLVQRVRGALAWMGAGGAITLLVILSL